MAVLKLNNVTTITESSGALTLANTALGTPTSVTLTNATFPAGSIVKWEPVVTTPAATQGADESYTTLTGSSKSYTPATGARYVVYEYSTNYMNDTTDARTIQILKFLYNGTMIDNGNWCIDTDGAANQWGFGYIHFKFIIDVSDPLRTGSSTAWPADTAKTLSITYRAFGSSYNAWWHRASKSLEASDTDVYPEIYQSTYSVM